MKIQTAGSVLAKQKRKNKKPYSRKQVSAAAIELGRAGGKKGGPVRAEALTDDQRTGIASHAANQRWGTPCFKSCPYC